MGNATEQCHRQYLADDDSFELSPSIGTNDLRNAPLTNQAYEYERLGDRTFNLCATFDTDISTRRLGGQ